MPKMHMPMGRAERHHAQNECGPWCGRAPDSSRCLLVLLGEASSRHPHNRVSRRARRVHSVAELAPEQRQLPVAARHEPARSTGH